MTDRSPIPAPRRRKPLRERLLSGLSEPTTETFQGTPHILWTRSVNSAGYGQLAGEDGYRLVLVHRAYWELTQGPIPDGMVPDHRCRNRRCVAHLEVVTTHENIQRAAAVRGTVKRPAVREVSPSKGRPRKTRCVHGHDLTQQGAQREYVTPTGHVQRSCRECERQRRLRKVVPVVVPEPVIGTAPERKTAGQTGAPGEIRTRDQGIRRSSVLPD